MPEGFGRKKERFGSFERNDERQSIDVYRAFRGREITLVNALEPSLHLKTKAISEQHQQGQHTTTFAEMYDLSFGARIIDTPGIRGFGIVDMNPQEVGDYFPEFFKLKEQCKFNNCLHREEPHCAVKEALDNDEVSWSRYKSYVQILEGDEENYRTDIYANGKNQDEES